MSVAVESEEEARQLYTLATTDRDTCRMEKTLAESRVLAAVLCMELYKTQVQKANEKLQNAEVEVGRVRSALRRCQFSRVLMSTPSYSTTNVSQFGGKLM
jgi:hypothetical protein